MAVPPLAQSSPSMTPIPSLKPAALVAVGWFAAALVASVLGAFRPTADAPPVAIGLAAGVPPLLVILLGARSPRFGAWARSLDLRFLTLLQSWRVAGVAFLALVAVHALPAGFAIPAGIGDVAIGLTAPFVAAFALGRSNRLLVAWTALGIADLVIAVTLGVLYSRSPIGVLRGDLGTDLMSSVPMVMIPAFGVPITLVLHVLSLVRLSHRRAVA